jgi:hypothetical protein
MAERFPAAHEAPRCACGAEKGPQARTCRACYRERASRTAAALLITLLPLPALAQEPAEPPAKPAPTIADYIAPSAWCPLRSGESEPDAFGCDGGIAVSLVSREISDDYTAAGVAFVGSETVGAGVAWCRWRWCVGVGVAAVRDDFGISLDTAAPVIGATFSLGGLREHE